MLTNTSERIIFSVKRDIRMENFPVYEAWGFIRNHSFHIMNSFKGGVHLTTSRDEKMRDKGDLPL